MTPIFRHERTQAGKTLPQFIHKEFDAFLDCEIPEKGFVRT
jgi:hypothetical protein